MLALVPVKLASDRVIDRRRGLPSFRPKAERENTRNPGANGTADPGREPGAREIAVLLRDVLENIHSGVTSDVGGAISVGKAGGSIYSGSPGSGGGAGGAT